ncbi:MAG TPA: hypothetical protein VF596_00240 [Pyrinomonadaceae bacterium]|jgi:hypothetical protein
MLDELVNRVAERTGLSQEQARTAAETVIGFLKERLPAPVAGALDGAVQGGETGSSGMMDQARGMLGNLGGMFGGNKE